MATNHIKIFPDTKGWVPASSYLCCKQGSVLFSLQWGLCSSMSPSTSHIHSLRILSIKMTEKVILAVYFGLVLLGTSEAVHPNFDRLVTLLGDTLAKQPAHSLKAFEPVEGPNLPYPPTDLPRPFVIPTLPQNHPSGARTSSKFKQQD